MGGNRDEENGLDVDVELLNVAIEESTENIQVLKRSLDTIATAAADSASANGALLEAHRAAHTLQGVGNAIGGPIAPVALVSRPAEELLAALRKRGTTPTKGPLACLVECALCLETMLDQLRAGKSARMPSAALLESLDLQLKRASAGPAP